MLDPVFCLETLERYKPQAEFKMNVKNGDAVPRIKVEASMLCTSSNISKGYGEYVKFYDVLHLMCQLKEELVNIVNSLLIEKIQGN